MVRRSSSSGCPSLRQAVGARCPLAVGAGVRVWGRGTIPLAPRALSGIARRGDGGRLPWGGTHHRCEGRLVSGALPLPACRPWGRLPGAAARVFQAGVVRVRGPITGPTACALASRRRVLREWQEGVPEGAP